MSALHKNVLEGLENKNKTIPSMFFYDEHGSAIYKKITATADYYLFQSEINALNRNKEKIVNLFGLNNDPYELIDLGAGDGTKMAILLEECVKQAHSLTYAPVDISLKFIEDALKHLKPYGVPLRPLEGDYHTLIPKLTVKNRKVFTFMGSNIGNFNTLESIEFLKNIRKSMRPIDSLMIGWDLVKDPAQILKAYNDTQGHTRDFNLNMLHRMNREMGGNINVEHFMHYPIFDPLELAAKSFLVSTVDQIVHLKKFDKKITFKKWEFIHTETSKKFTPDSIKSLIKDTGFKLDEIFFCNQEGYALTLLSCDAQWKTITKPFKAAVYP